MFLSEHDANGLHYVNATSTIDFPAEQQPGLIYPPYPYRTHGTACVDVDQDGDLEMALLNGGPALSPDTVREPNWLFQLDFAESNWFKIELRGDGKDVSLDAIGTRLALTLTDKHGATRTFHRTLHGGSCFSARDGFVVHFYLRRDEAITSLSIAWPNNRRSEITAGMAVNTALKVEYARL